MSPTDRDLEIARMLDDCHVPDHGPAFWPSLSQVLRSSKTANGRTPDHITELTVDPARPNPAATKSRRLLLLGAAAAAVLIAIAAVYLRPDDEIEVVPSSGDQTTSPPPTTESTGDTAAPSSTTEAPGTTPPADSAASGAATATLGFLDALGSGDFDGAASVLGPLSEAYLDATAGSVEEHLRVAEEGYGAWAAVRDRTVLTLELRPGEVVVVVSGTLTVEGSTEERHDAFPVRYSESAGVWFVEPWAQDPASSGVELFGDVDRGVVLGTPGPGEAWLSIDGGHPSAVEVGDEGTASWRVPETVAPGEHIIIAAFINDTTFGAIAWEVDY